MHTDHAVCLMYITFCVRAVFHSNFTLRNFRDCVYSRTRAGSGASIEYAFGIYEHFFALLKTHATR